MMRKALITTIFYIAIVLVAASPAVVTPPVPSWQRGSGGATFQEWSFHTGGNDPDIWQNEYGHYTDPGLGLSVKSQGWFDNILRADGVYALLFEMDVVLPNRITTDPDSYKDIQIYLVWRPIDDVDGSNLITDPFLPDSPLVAVTPYDEKQESVEDVIDNGWHYSTYEIRIWPNPDKEWFSIKGNILVDYLSIDTICVPEPMTIVIMTAGGLFALRLRKYKH